MKLVWTSPLDFRAFRPPYLDEFFEDVARRVPLSGREDLLDLTCGAGEVAVGFAPYVASLTGLDEDPGLLTEAQRRLAATGRPARLVNVRADEAPEALGKFDVIVSGGKGVWTMRTPGLFSRIDGWLRPGGCVIICLPLNNNVGSARWFAEHQAIVRRWDREKLADLVSLPADRFFMGSAFDAVDQVTTYGERTVDLEHLVKRAWASPPTTRERLGADADRMADEIRAALAPYFRNGPLVEHHCTIGVIHRRRTERQAR